MSVEAYVYWIERTQRLRPGPDLEPRTPEEAWVEYLCSPSLAPGEARPQVGPAPDPDPTHTVHLITRLRSGDQRAWAELLERFKPELVREVRKYVKNNAENMDDILQAVYLKAVRGIPGFEYRGHGSLLAWLKRLARNEAMNLVDPRRLRPQSLEGSEAGLLERLTDDKSLSASGFFASKEVQEALKRLTPEDRRVLELRYEHGLSLKEIARVLGCSETVASDRVRRALTHLRGLLGE